MQIQGPSQITPNKMKKTCNTCNEEKQVAKEMEDYLKRSIYERLDAVKLDA